jgi:WhiB family redox-sensing transcriptional regulator
VNDLQRTFVAVKRAQDWLEDANCKNMDTNLFFPEFDKPVDKFVKEVCDSCDVASQCLWYANETKAYDGIFGGLSPNQRDHWRRKNGVLMGDSEQEWNARKSGNLLRRPIGEWS